MLNKEQLLEAAKVMQEAAKGKDIQYQDRGQPSPDKWYPIPNPVWDWNHNIYRVKPDTIKYRMALFDQGNMRPHVGIYMEHQKDIAEGASKSRTFVRWLTDWIEVEI